jgi:hypothetical protein
MKLNLSVCLVIGLVYVGHPAAAQVVDEVEKLRAQIHQLQEDFEKARREHQNQLEELTRKVSELSTRAQSQVGTTSAMASVPMPNLSTAEPGASPPGVSTREEKWSPTKPLTLARAGQSYMNISFDALVDGGWSTASDPGSFLQLGDHDPIKRGFTLPNAEISLDGAVDPYFKGFANLLFKLDGDNETEVELEEAYLQSSSLPANLQLKAGQFLAAFGRQNTQHPHQWAFVDAPIILTRAFGPEGLRNPGAQLSWLLPTPFYAEASLGVFDGAGGTAFSFRNEGEDGTMHGRATTSHALRGAGDLVYVPRLATSFDLTDQQSLLLGASAAFGPNLTSAHSRSEVYGVDLYWKWKAAKSRQGFPFVAWQTEALYQRFGAGTDVGAGLPSEGLRDWGFYSQILWGFRQRWVAGMRGEYTDGNTGAFDPMDIFRGERSRISPSLTFYPSEFSKIRLQYNRDQGEAFGTEHSVWLQVEFLLGAHGAHQF